MGILNFGVNSGPHRNHHGSKVIDGEKQIAEASWNYLAGMLGNAQTLKSEGTE